MGEPRLISRAGDEPKSRQDLAAVIDLADPVSKFLVVGEFRKLGTVDFKILAR